MPGQYDVEFEAAADRPPFSNGTEGDAWLGNWCAGCVHDRDQDTDGGCALVLISLMGRTPAAWEPDRPGSLGHQYRCTEYRRGDP